MNNENREVSIRLPDAFWELCEHDLVTPEAVLKGFIADVCGISVSTDFDYFRSPASEDRNRAWSYYEKLHVRDAQWKRENLPHLFPPNSKVDDVHLHCVRFSVAQDRHDVH